ncbi:MAG: imidazole glycerol phosphate synthase subunit HisH [Chloroflexi bacterium]|nr:imidazole glycerol phosphate synthase subunit HisH [Chloroflexota bacterium]MCI0581013.1 imidazole glycerol phosphate synthase subunit HisH [Chloroflexota bacterium]MCI0646352.1 imidazole glycerol phosphate synthase subunit HisH [Chloroflexota bacterium]MCI0728390.1 imidazole glycerol phosphate synthase subunit HisH [Chloroflexota bacterium]
MIALVDSGVGNLRSVEKALATVGAEVCLTADPAIILAAGKVALPGVGAFGDTMDGLRRWSLVGVLEQVAGRCTPLLGICVGMQVLFEGSEEMGDHAGLGLLPGRVRRFALPGLKVPQTGWNQLEPVRPSPLFRDLPPGSYAYFNHSYYCDPADPADVLAVTEYGLPYASAVQRGNLYGVQFHPEKSQAVGLAILRNFVAM